MWTATYKDDDSISESHCNLFWEMIIASLLLTNIIVIIISTIAMGYKIT